MEEMRVYIANLGKYNEGELIGDWFTPPVNYDEMAERIPVAVTWFMSQKTFDGKKPYGFLKSSISYLLRPKVTYAGKAVKLKTELLNTAITAVRSDVYVPH